MCACVCVFVCVHAYVCVYVCVLYCCMWWVCMCASHTHTHHIQQYKTHTLKPDKHTILIYHYSFVQLLLENGFTMKVCTFCVVLLKSVFFLTFCVFGSQVCAVSNIASPPTEDETHLHKDKCVQKNTIQIQSKYTCKNTLPISIDY